MVASLIFPTSTDANVNAVEFGSLSAQCVLCTLSSMEGIGSRLGRASSRYGSAPVFTGPVRRWQKQWVQVPSSSSSSSVSYNHNSSFNNNNGQSNNNNNNNNSNVSAVRLRRWTPVPSAHSGGDSEAVQEERPRRKLRYTPIVVLEEKKKGAEKADHEAKSIKRKSIENDDNEKLSFDNVFTKQAQASDKSDTVMKDLNASMDLDLALKGRDDNNAPDSSNKEADWVKAARTGFAR